jgi:predicted amidophosphoribosyltransferase
VPIPLSARRLRQRGYNQAAALARALGTEWHLPVAERLLSRTRDTGTQTALTPEARAKNVAGAFIASPQNPGPALGIRPIPHPAHAPDAANAAHAAHAAGPHAAHAACPHAAHAAGPRGAPIILVDDVLTTGATLVAAATAFGAAGWPAVGAVTFARALPYERRAAG